MGSVNQHDGFGHDSVGMERIDRNDGSPDIEILQESRHRRLFAALIPANANGDGHRILMAPEDDGLEMLFAVAIRSVDPLTVSSQGFQGLSSQLSRYPAMSYRWQSFRVRLGHDPVNRRERRGHVTALGVAPRPESLQLVLRHFLGVTRSRQGADLAG